MGLFVRFDLPEFGNSLLKK